MKFFKVFLLLIIASTLLFSGVNILKKAGIKFSTNLDRKVCCGGPSFNIRDFTTANDFAEKKV